MYYYIKGTLAAKGENYLVVDAQGVGYMIYTSSSAVEKAGTVGNEITVYTYLNVREDAMELYGFLSEEERKMFLLLISVSGVGPKAATALLSISSPQKIAAAIVTGDEKIITKAPGVGPKAAKRIILELRDKIDNTALGLESSEVHDISHAQEMSNSVEEALSALTVLGYDARTAKNILLKLDSSLSTEELIKKALTQLM